MNAPDQLHPEFPDVPLSGRWVRVSRRYAWMQLCAALLLGVAAGAVLWGVQWVITEQISAGEITTNPELSLGIFRAAALLVLVILLLNTAFAYRRARSVKYQLRADDLLFQRGIFRQRTVAVPYGRLQLVDLRRGPLQRMLGLSTLHFVTASAASGVVLPGMRADDADQLRDTLVALAETRRSGL